MYRIINSHIEQVLDSIHHERDVNSYVWLQEQFAKTNVATDAAFQKQYRRYWRLNTARLSDHFLAIYFGILEESKRTPDISVETVARRLHKTPSHADGRKSLQFSFSTKLVHMLRPRAPIYDRAVEAFFFLGPSVPSEEPDRKLRRRLRAYDFLVREYDRVLGNNILEQSLIEFRTRFDPNYRFTNEKIVDTLIWRFVTLLRSGALADARVRYF